MCTCVYRRVFVCVCASITPTFTGRFREHSAAVAPTEAAAAPLPKAVAPAAPPPPAARPPWQPGAATWEVDEACGDPDSQGMGPPAGDPMGDECRRPRATLAELRCRAAGAGRYGRGPAWHHCGPDPHGGTGAGTIWPRARLGDSEIGWRRGNNTDHGLGSSRFQCPWPGPAAG